MLTAIYNGYCKLIEGVTMNINITNLSDDDWMDYDEYVDNCISHGEAY